MFREVVGVQSRFVLLIVGVVLVATTLSLVPTGNAVAAVEEICYADERGRIVKRRRSGYFRVECPSDKNVDIETAPGTKSSKEATGFIERRRPDRSGSETVVAVDDPSSIEWRERNRASASQLPIPDWSAFADGSDKSSIVAMPDRWRIVDNLKGLGYNRPWWDPYNRNVLKGDKPVVGEWFFSLNAISDTVIEPRQVPTPVGISTTQNAGQLDVFGGADQLVLSQNVATELVYLKGDTVFRPPDHEFRFTPVFNINYVEVDENLALNIRPSSNDTRKDEHVGVQALFYDKHLRNVSDRYDFDSFRIGIQPFSSDFRGFLFQDQQLGARLFGTRRNNIFQYNLAWFKRLQKDTNSGLNDLGKSLRKDDVFLANLYWQDFPVLGFQSQFSAYYNRNREDEFYFDNNGFIARPASLGLERSRSYDAYYLGYNGDGHFGRLNLTSSFYFAFGEERQSVFSGRDSDIEALFIASEVSYDLDWFRPRLSFLYASGDDDPFDDQSSGFDAIFENPQFAGADTSYWIRQPVPLIGGGRVTLSNRNGILNSLRSSKEEGQSNFVNPGIVLVGVGADADVLPSLRVAVNYNYLRFDTTETVELARNQGRVDEEIGHDVSIVATYRPFSSQNVVLRASYARLIPGDGYRDLFPDEGADYFLLNLLLAF